MASWKWWNGTMATGGVRGGTSVGGRDTSPSPTSNQPASPPLQERLLWLAAVLTLTHPHPHNQHLRPLKSTGQVQYAGSAKKIRMSHLIPCSCQREGLAEGCV